MKNSSIKLKDVIDRDVAPDEAADVVDYLLACLTHITNARPLFGVFNIHSGQLEWSAGGADFHDVLHRLKDNDLYVDVQSIKQLFSCLGLSDQDLALVHKQINTLGSDSSLQMLPPMFGNNGQAYRMVMRRRRKPNDQHVQFTLLDIKPFQKSTQRIQSMARALLEDLSVPIEHERGADKVLLSIIDDLEVLFALKNDADIKAMADNMSTRVTLVSERLVDLLLAFERRFETSHWQPDDLNPNLSPMIAVHTSPRTDWMEMRNELLRVQDGEPTLVGVNAFGLKQAFDFVQHAVSLFVISLSTECMYILNGPKAGQKFSTLETFVQALEVEENSTQTAQAFFQDLYDKSALGVFAIADRNMEVWGRPGFYGGWQAMLVESSGRGVDVRGLFHGLKNLLLHLQVLYVVKSQSDIEQVQSALTESGQKIRSRLADLKDIANTGRRKHDFVEESVAQWLRALHQLGLSVDCEVKITSTGVDEVRFSCVPGEMEDTLEELVRNAIQHGANEVTVNAERSGDYLCLQIQDNGPGLSDEKLQQIRQVITTGDYDPALSTRSDGTGNGLLAAANAVKHFVDGTFDIHHGPHGQGVEITISMKLVSPK